MSATAIIYARVSTAEQAEDDLPVDGQIDRCHEKSAQLQAEVVRVFRDDGVSGAAAARPAFEAALDYACTRGVTYFICWSSSRFARDRVRASASKRLLEHSGVQLVYCTMDVDTSTTGGWMLDSMMEIFDEMVSRQVAVDTRRSMERNARAGYWGGGTVPYGFRAVPDAENTRRRRLQPDPYEAPLVQEVFQLAREHGAAEIARRLNERGATYRGKRWLRSSVRGVIASRAVMGQIVFNQVDRRTRKRRPFEDWIIVDSHDPLVSREVWEAAQARREEGAANSDSGSPHSSHAFTGLLRCGRCGSRMQVYTGKGRSKRYFYYRCRGAMIDKTHQPDRGIPAPEFDAWLTDVICDQVLTEKTLLEVMEELNQAAHNWEAERSERRRQVVARLQGVRNRLEKLYDVLELYGREAPNLADLTKRLRRYRTEEDQLEGDLQAIDHERPPELQVSPDEIQDFAHQLREIVRQASGRQARQFFQEFVSQVTIEGDVARIEYRPDCLVAVPSSEKERPGQPLLGTGSVVGTVRVLEVEAPARFRVAA